MSDQRTHLAESKETSVPLSGSCLRHRSTYVATSVERMWLLGLLDDGLESIDLIFRHYQSLDRQVNAHTFEQQPPKIQVTTTDQSVNHPTMLTRARTASGKNEEEGLGT